MRLRYLFLIFVTLLTAIWILLLLQTPLHNSKIFYITEAVTLVCLLFLIYFYRKAVKPINSITNGMNLLHEQDFSSKLSPVGQYEADQIVEIFNRMMQQMKNERLKLREQNHFLDLLINASPMGVIILDFEQRIITINPSAKKFIATDENIIGCKLQDIQSALAQKITMIKDETSQTIRLNGVNVYHCSRLSFRDRGFAHPFILIEQMTDEVRRAEKNAYEKIIRMIAHEVNNTMGGITSTLDSAADVLQTITPDTLQTDTEELCSVMKVCEERGYNMSRFITRFADVVKIPEPVPIATDLNDCVQQCKRFIEQMCHQHNITFSLQLSNEKIPVSIDVTLFEQVLVNIIKNSIESIGADGEISITTNCSPASIVITDNGKGISKDIEQHLFSPFFTTKSGGQGIGLIFIREVLSNHGFRYSLRTDDDNLTRFTILF
ncbi:MAG: PAS domain-containing sensor histidine kinase [Bacteroidaceae bacterium]|nr:PAS domain-containing sensor histidine kinase [Bacteroidaceae bacterium]